MVESQEFRELLIADVALLMGAAAARDVAMALQRYWDAREQGGNSLGKELQLLANLPDETLAKIEAEADRLISEAGGNPQIALTRQGGLDRSIHVALSARGANLSRVLTEAGGGIRAPLRRMPEDRYVDFEIAGEGGMGTVYMAYDTELHRAVALKVVRTNAGRPNHRATPTTPLRAVRPSHDAPEIQAFEQLRARLIHEAWVTGALEHPGVVPIHELGETPQGIPYYTMRFVRGQRTMKEALDEVRDAPIGERLRLLESFLRLCDTVRYAHSKGVVHRDLKPENVALGEFGEVILLDWGLAKFEGREDLVASRWQERVRELRGAGDLRTLAGAVGSPGYMSPEAALGRLDQVGVKSDVYSIGVLLYEILTGRLPYEFSTYGQYIDALTNRDAPEARGVDDSVPTRLSDLCARCLERDLDARPDQVATVSQEIRDWQTSSQLEREIEALLDGARASLRDGEAATGTDRLRRVDLAVSALEQIGKKQPDHPALRDGLEQASALRDQGIAEVQKTAARGRLRRAAPVVLLLVFAQVLILAILGLGAIWRDRQEAQRSAESANRRRAEAALGNVLQQARTKVRAALDDVKRLHSYADLQRLRQDPYRGRHADLIKAVYQVDPESGVIYWLDGDHRLYVPAIVRAAEISRSLEPETAAVIEAMELDHRRAQRHSSEDRVLTGVPLFRRFPYRDDRSTSYPMALGGIGRLAREVSDAAAIEQTNQMYWDLEHVLLAALEVVALNEDRRGDLSFADRPMLVTVPELVEAAVMALPPERSAIADHVEAYRQARMSLEAPSLRPALTLAVDEQRLEMMREDQDILAIGPHLIGIVRWAQVQGSDAPRHVLVLMSMAATLHLIHETADSAILARLGLELRLTPSSTFVSDGSVESPQRTPSGEEPLAAQDLGLVPSLRLPFRAELARGAPKHLPLGGRGELLYWGLLALAALGLSLLAYVVLRLYAR